MIGGLSKSASRLAVTAAAGLFMSSIALTPATAADLGGDCCADLEERVAELEATTARKGNRKVSLTVSGHVNTALLWWDDGYESDTYIVTSNNSRSRFRFKGSAKMHDGWSAGFLIEIGLKKTNSGSVSQNTDDAGGGLDIRHEVWWIRNDNLGEISVGHSAQSIEGIWEVDLSGTGVADYGGVGFLSNSFILRGTDGVFVSSGSKNVTWGNVLNEYDGNRVNRVRYDTPTFAGFTLSASWGENDEWDVALRYANQFGDFRVAAAIGHHEVTDKEGDPDKALTSGSAAVLHVPTGLSLQGGWGEFDSDAVNVSDSSGWWVKAGLQRKFLARGKTSFSVTYGRDEDRLLQANQLGGGGISLDGGTNVYNVVSSEATYWGVGVVQNIDAAAMKLYIGYRHQEIDGLVVDIAGVPTDISGRINDLDTIVAGGLIKF